MSSQASLQTPHMLHQKLFMPSRAMAGSRSRPFGVADCPSTETVYSLRIHWINDRTRRIRARQRDTRLYPKLKRLQIPLPPLDEQKRIAGILDAADALRAKRREALAQLDTLLQSTFLDMFGDPVTNPWGGAWLAMSTPQEDGPHVSPTYAESGVPFLSTRHIKKEVVW